MAIFKCKMCGGTLEINESQTIATCEYCGTQQTLPRLEDDRRANLYDRANHFRRNNEFDKAMGIYEQILSEDGSDAEAYWSLVLCRYGIEYVEDPATHKRVPTVNRAQYTSVFDDDNYRSALQHADGRQRSIYEAEAQAINEIQKGILAISQREEPFDVFICYKETDSSGRRTPDSVLANDLYHQLTQEGFKVFFSRITLEDKLGSAYEPYIFAALNSAKVMVVLGTRPEYFSAVWVKNEWSRYLALIRQGQKKMLIPAYKDMDPYDLPEEFSHLQAQDMTKLGFMQDLIRGIKKITQVDAPRPVVKETTVVTGGGGNAAPLLERGTMALEDGEWSKADGFFEDVLNQDSKNARAYLGKALAQEQCATLEALVDKHIAAARVQENSMKNITPPRDEAHIAESVTQYSIPEYLAETEIRRQFAFDPPSYVSSLAFCQRQCQEQEAWWAEHKLLSRAEKFAEGDFAQELQTAKKRLLDTLAQRLQQSEDDEATRRQQAQESYAQQLETADQAVKALYQQGTQKREKDYRALVAQAEKAHRANELSEAAVGFEKLGDYQSSRALAQQYRRRAEEQERIEAKKTSKRMLIGACALAAAIALALLLTQVILPYAKYGTPYKDAVALMEAGQYDEAIAAFEALDGYRDSAEQITECKYLDAVALMEAEQYDEAIAAFEALDRYKDSAEQISECKYLDAVALMEAGQYDEAIAAFEALEGYKDSAEQIETYLNGKYNDAVTLLEKGDSMGALALFQELGAYKDAKERCKELMISLTPRETISVYESYAAGLKSDGTVVTAGSSLWIQDVSDWRDIVAISVGICHTVGLKADGTVVATGSNDKGQCGVSGWTDIVTISAGGHHTVGLKSDGTVVAVGKNDNGQRNVSGWTHIMAISAGFRHTVGLKADGIVVAVGDNNDGQRNVTSWTDIVAISAGNYHTVGLKADGTVVAVGNNDDGQCNVSGWRGIVSISAGRCETVGLKSNGSVVAAEKTGTMSSMYKAYQRDLSGWTNIKLPK